LNNPRLLAFLFILGSVLIIAACGKKAPPFLSENDFHAGVNHLSGEWDEGEILLKGPISPPLESGKDADIIRGARIYYAQYPLENAPCDDCPIEFHGFDTLDQEVIIEGDFRYCVPGKEQGNVYFFKVHLMGAEGTMGPPSNTVRIIVEQDPSVRAAGIGNSSQ
jgi:hypothetical protein